MRRHASEHERDHSSWHLPAAHVAAMVPKCATRRAGDTDALRSLVKCVNEHKSLVAAMLGMQGSYTYPSAIPGLGGLSFPEPGASGLVRFVANDNSSVGLNWYLAKPSVHLNRSVDGGSGGTAFATNWAAR